MPLTVNGTGAIGSSVAVRDSASSAIDVQELQSGGLEPVHQDLGESCHQLVPELLVLRLRLT